MNLSTFGRDFKLRLKRNADFQQRLKDMKMFLAESTSDGQLRYTEIKAPHQAHQKQEPHKRAATADEDSQWPATSESASKQSRQQQQQRQQQQELPSAKTAAAAAAPTSPQNGTTTFASGAGQPDGAGRKGQQQQQEANSDHWNIGATYHDEDNLAALLIEHDSSTGRIQVDGTIGNDYVIKPMPRATLEALAAHGKRRAAASQPDLERAPSSSSSAQANPAGGGQQQPNQQQPQQQTTNQLSPAEAAAHLHDDDPHDDDEMFLDEDEALELAHLEAGSSHLTNRTGTAAGKLAQVVQQPQQQQPRILSKAASERKWRKYRKLLAQTKVPKVQETPVASERRARRHSRGGGPDQREEEAAAMLSERHHANLRMSHHIVFKQRPSSEASSSEHRHSFMLAPGQQAMEEMARNLRGKRSTEDNSLHLDAAPSRLSRAHSHESQPQPQPQPQLGEQAPDESWLTDAESDPMGGQFYLEPGLLTGVGRAGEQDWSLWPDARLGARSPKRARPPYALNETHTLTPGPHKNGTHARYKRHLSRGPAARAAPLRPGGGPNAGRRRNKRQAPDVVWPEVLLVVDYDSFLLHGGDSREVKRYFVSFWNGVDLRYKLLVNPHIRISLAGMIVAKDRDATPYLERNRLRAPNADAVDAAGALTDMGKYLYREDRLPTYDLAVVITKLDMCRRRYEGGRCNRGTAGFAYVGGACVVNKRLEKVNSVAIIEDSGGFSGIIVAAHEVGHLLGCVHDGSPPPSYLGGPGATHCPWEDGFIMSDLRHTERGFRWSQCSVEQFKHFLNGETATCLYNYPHESQMLHRLLPGSMLSLDDQCKRDRGTNACFKDSRVCAQLFCFDSASGYCVSYRPAAEGSPCGEGHVCRNGKCVGEIENIIPDYTHQTQTVVPASRAQRPLVVAPGGGGGNGGAHSSARLADNGLSASSTSTATSSPDASAKSAAAPLAQISSRMDSSLPVNYTPILTNFNALYTPGALASPNGRRQLYSAALTASPKSAKLAATTSAEPASLAASQFGGRYSLAPTYAASLAARNLRRTSTTSLENVNYVNY